MHASSAIVGLARKAALASVLLLLPSLLAADTVRVLANRANVRLQPSISSPVIATVDIGTVLEVEAQEGEWYRVAFPPDAQGLRKVGYISAGEVELRKATGTTIPANAAASIAGLPRSTEPDQPSPTVRTEGGEGVRPTRNPDTTRSLATDEQVRDAIELGRVGKVDSFLAKCSARPGFGESIGRRLFSSGIQPLGGFDVYVFNHLGMIANTAWEYTRLYKPFALTDVTDDMRRPGIFVIVTPEKSRNWDEDQAPVQGIVLRSKSMAQSVVHPLETNANYVGDDLHAEGIYGMMYKATLSFDDVTGLPAGDIEAVLVTTAGERKCTLDDDDRDKLGRR